jgi:hypothetical protein
MFNRCPKMRKAPYRTINMLALNTVLSAAALARDVKSFATVLDTYIALLISNTSTLCCQRERPESPVFRRVNFLLEIETSTFTYSISRRNTG